MSSSVTRSPPLSRGTWARTPPNTWRLRASPAARLPSACSTLRGTRVRARSWSRSGRYTCNSASRLASTRQAWVTSPSARVTSIRSAGWLKAELSREAGRPRTTSSAVSEPSVSASCNWRSPKSSQPVSPGRHSWPLAGSSRDGRSATGSTWRARLCWPLVAWRPPQAAVLSTSSVRLRLPLKWAGRSKRSPTSEPRRTWPVLSGVRTDPSLARRVRSLETPLRTKASRSVGLAGVTATRSVKAQLGAAFSSWGARAWTTREAGPAKRNRSTCNAVTGLLASAPLPRSRAMALISMANRSGQVPRASRSWR